MKPFLIPDTSSWFLNPKYLNEDFFLLESSQSNQPKAIVIDFLNLDKLTLQLISNSELYYY
jgi:hypothetical protein